VPFGTASSDGGRWPADRPVVGTHERLSWLPMVGFGLQHVLAMAGAALLVPALTGFPVSATLLFSGIGTLLFLLLTRNRLPAFLGPSFAFVAPLQAAQGSGFADQLGGVLVVGVVVAGVGIAVKALGPRLIGRLMPPVVIGAVVVLLGLALARGTADMITEQPAIAAATVAAMLIAALLLPGDARRLAVFICIPVAWLAAVPLGGLDLARVGAMERAAWIGLPELSSPQITPAIVIVMLPVTLVLIAENIGGLQAIGAVTARPVDRLAGDTLIAVGLGTTLAGLGGGTGASIRPENVGVLAASRVAAYPTVIVAAVTAVALSASPKAAALLLTIPPGVVGGAGIVLFALLVLAGVRVWLRTGVELADPVTLALGVVALVAGAGGLTVTVGDVPVGGLTWGTVAIVALYPLLRLAFRRAPRTEPTPVRRPGTGPGWQVEQK